MKTRIFTVCIFAASFAGLHAQKVLTLQECYKGAFSANALSDEKQAHSDISKLRDRNLSANYLPVLDASGSFVYNSSVPDLTGALGELPDPFASAIRPMPHEQYKITLDINQVIYDGGATRNAKALEKTGLGINEIQTESELYKIRSQVSSYYFNIILLQKQREILDDYLQLVTAKMAAMSSALKSGFILSSDIDILAAEKIKLEQQLKGNEIRMTSLRDILSNLTGIPIDTAVLLVLPEPAEEPVPELSRPELRLFEMRKEQLTAANMLIDSRRMPKISAFASLGYGNPPGNNFFRDEFAPYYIMGAGVKWNIIDWNKARNEKQINVLQKGIIDGRKADMEDNLRRMLESKNAEIRSLEAIIESDAGLILLRGRITAAAESQYENGTITAAELLSEMSSESQTILNHEIHKINLAMARIDYLNISGQEIE
ncbi:MAG: TolC family protein [Bacteroidales bacterium]|nr:TolC family protein [Bacteroidales bacterium]